MSPSHANEIIKALARTENVNGDVCEFGVAQGKATTPIFNEILNITKPCIYSILM